MALLQANIFSRTLLRNTTFNAIIPADKFGFDGKSLREPKPFKTLYLLHGIFGNYTDWVIYSRIVPWAQNKNLAVIMPSGDNHFYIDNEKTFENYGRYIGEELVDLTRRMFKLSDKREDTYIGGLSMGGYGAVRNGLKYSDTFSHIISLSSAFTMDTINESTYDNPDITKNRNYFESIFGDLSRLAGSENDYKSLVTRCLEENFPLPRFYMACGTEDFLIKENRDYHNFLLNNGVDVTYEEGPGIHDWTFWDSYMEKALNWLPLEEESLGIFSGNVKRQD